jgi:hypothetical protein
MLVLSRLRKAFDDLWQAVGGRIEEFAHDLVPELLEQFWRLHVISAGPERLKTSRGHHQFDLVVRGTIDDDPVTVVCQVKDVVAFADVKRFPSVVQKLQAANPDEHIRPVFFGHRADRKAREEISKAGAAMVFTRGVIIPAA